MGNENFSRTGDGWVTFNIPANVESLTNVELRGGGSPNNAAGLVMGSIDVKGIDAIVFYLGEAGHGNSGGSGGAGGSNGSHDGLHMGAGGRGGDSTTGPGGDGGGSGSAVWTRKNGKYRLIAVAGGAGGDSGNGGNGGPGGAAIGGDGGKGDTNGGVGGFTAATGGRQNQGGFGGISGVPGHNGQDADPGRFGKAGNGHTDVRGGGGGGSGYYSGGGGQGGVPGQAPDGGGAGGSNFIGGMHKGAQSIQGNGGAGDGSLKFFWQKKKGNHPPTVPSEVKVNGKPETPNMGINSNTTAEITAKIFDPDHDRVRLLGQIATNKNFNGAHPTPPKHSGWHQIKKKNPQPQTATITFTNLRPATEYWVRLWTEDEHGQRSLNYNVVHFWTNRKPDKPILTGPPNYILFPDTATIDFTWQHNDPDGGAQSAFRLRYRVAGTPTQDPLPWHYVGGKDKTVESSTESWSLDGDQFLGNYRYEWQVMTRDTRNRWSPWSASRSFATRATLTPPQLEDPANYSGEVQSGVDYLFTWHHVNWQQGLDQYTADFRYRAYNPDVSDDDAVWHTIFGTADTPGAATELLVPGVFDFGGGLETTFIAGVEYAWQVRTYSAGDPITPSKWSEAFRFIATHEVGSGLPDVDPGLQVTSGPLGCGNNRVFVATRPIFDKETGEYRQVTLGEITPMTSVQWTRLRDDISSCLVTTVQFGDDCGELLAQVRSWQHELIVYRDGVRAWEGPVTRVAYHTDRVEIEAKDPMVYVYRRVMRVGYNDTYRKVHGVIVNGEGRSVVDRATRIIQNALCYDDPNVLAYLTRLDSADDADESRSLAAYQKTAWEEVDDLAATAGLDYTVVGRRIILNDVHTQIGRLPVMRSGDFSEDPVVTEYGMSMANVFYVSSSGGQWGSATPVGDTVPPLYYPYVEQLTSAYGESAEDAKKTVTADKKVSLSAKLEDQAERHIAHRWPAPVQIRVPDNAILNPELDLGINQLIPGVWIPVQATGTLRAITQWQKLDSVTVQQTGDTPEQISVILTPAPLGDEDDSDLELEGSFKVSTDSGTAT